MLKYQNALSVPRDVHAVHKDYGPRGPQGLGEPGVRSDEQLGEVTVGMQGKAGILGQPGPPGDIDEAGSQGQPGISGPAERSNLRYVSISGNLGPIGTRGKLGKQRELTRNDLPGSLPDQRVHLEVPVHQIYQENTVSLDYLDLVVLITALPQYNISTIIVKT
ncbi:hypothetical protein X798_00288 [Onchocerca flexuosa]|uniref:Collagen triple helix repeat protein n=2 Tax=Onchocerca flexuosa TaxID=387005 RepID=A0A183HDL2_9BILA|nr:hypothetical protein X798_00288 [Onchocerca flexuosa]VDO43582.1 unnamed protein product [Onchocerca flexuosa]